MTRDPDLEALLKQAEALRSQSDALLQAAKGIEKEVRRLAARQPKNGHPEVLQARSTSRIRKPDRARDSAVFAYLQHLDEVREKHHGLDDGEDVPF